MGELGIHGHIDVPYLGHQCSIGTSVVNRILHAVHEDILFVIWWMQNLLDFLSTKVAVGTGRAIELNGLVNGLGGPFAMPSIILKMVIVPIIIYLSYWIFKQNWGKSSGIGVMIVTNVEYLAVLTNNFAVLDRILD
jgi:hypothetical protein